MVVVGSREVQREMRKGAEGEGGLVREEVGDERMDGFADSRDAGRTVTRSK